MVALAVVFLVLTFLTVDFFYARWAIWRDAARVSSAAAKAVHLPRIDGRPPHGLFLAPGHTWVTLEGGEGEVRVGVDAIASGILGEIDELALAPVGARVARGDVVVTLRRGARQVELRSPLAGTIEAVNESPERDPDILRRDPYADGWLFRMKVDALTSQLGETHAGDEAAQFLARELGRLRDALARSGGMPGVGATLADGGLVAEDAMVPVEDAVFAEIAAEIFDPARARSSERGTP